MLTPSASIDSDIKRIVRAAAALHGIYDDRALGRAVGRTGITVGRWWQGQQPDGRTLYTLAQAIGLDPSELAAFVYDGGPAPTLRPVLLADQERIAAKVEEARAIVWLL